MDNHTRLMHHARRRVMWMPLVVVGILFAIVSITNQIHFIEPGRICFPFTKDIEWNYTSSTWIDIALYFCALITFFYYQRMFAKHKANIRKMWAISAIIIVLMSIVCMALGETEKGRQIISSMLANTMFGSILIPEYSSIVFSVFVGTLGGVVTSTIFSLLKVTKDIVQIIFLCTIMGATSGLVTFVELAIHADILRALLFGITIGVLNILVNALCIASAGLPAILLQKIASAITDNNEKKENARRKRMKEM